MISQIVLFFISYLRTSNDIYKISKEQCFEVIQNAALLSCKNIDTGLSLLDDEIQEHYTKPNLQTNNFYDLRYIKNSGHIYQCSPQYRGSN